MKLWVGKKERWITNTQSDMEYAVVADRLTKKFGKFIAVDHVSFKVKRGEVFGFLGPNGAGKSTTIRMLCGLLLPTEARRVLMGLILQNNPTM